MSAVALPGRSGWRAELIGLVKLAGPLAAAQMAQVLMGTTDAVMMGRIGTDALAAGGLGTSITMMMIVIAQGLIQSIQPIVAQGRGAEDHRIFGRTLAGGLTTALICAVPMVILLTHFEPILLALHEPPVTARLTQSYEYAFAWGIPASMLQAVLRNYLSAFGRTRIIMLVASLACAANFGLNWLLIFGHWGLPALGLAGSGYATAIVWWGMALSLALYCWRRNLLPADLFRLTRREIWLGVSAILGLGWPIAGIWAVELGLFSGTSVLIGQFGPVALAAHQICINICSLFFNVPLSIGFAATVRVGFHIGRGAPHDAQIAGFTAIALGTGFMVFAALSIRLLAEPIFTLYLDPSDPAFPAVETLGRSLIAVAALFQVFDGAQTVAAGALRGLKDTRTPLVAGIAGYWFFGLPAGIGLCYGAGWGPVGLWWGFVVGLVAVSLLLGLRFWQRSGQLIETGPAVLARTA